MEGGPAIDGGFGNSSAVEDHKAPYLSAGLKVKTGKTRNGFEAVRLILPRYADLAPNQLQYGIHYFATWNELKRYYPNPMDMESELKHRSAMRQFEKENPIFRALNMESVQVAFATQRNKTFAFQHELEGPTQRFYLEYGHQCDGKDIFFVQQAKSNDRGQKCTRHNACGTATYLQDIVYLKREQTHDMDAMVAYRLEDGQPTCRIGYVDLKLLGPGAATHFNGRLAQVYPLREDLLVHEDQFNGLIMLEVIGLYDKVFRDMEFQKLTNAGKKRKRVLSKKKKPPTSTTPTIMTL